MKCLSDILEWRKHMKFKEQYIKGLVEFETIDDYSHEWGMGDDDCTLCEFLGLNEEEEEAWISQGEDALYDLLEAQKEV